jgi:hypothetical protein
MWLGINEIVLRAMNSNDGTDVVAVAGVASRAGRVEGGFE